MRSVIGAGVFFVCAVAVHAAPLLAQLHVRNGTSDDEDPIVVTGVRDIVVNGHAIRCRRLPGDPLDRVIAPYGQHNRVAVIPQASGGFALEQDSEQITGPEFWQRVGVGFDQYVFRSPSNRRPMCVGGTGDMRSYGGFRRIVDAASYRGHRVRFTLWVATSQANLVHFWLAAGTNETKPRPGARRPINRLYNGGNTNNVDWGGNNGWTPVLLETGPVSSEAAHISYGFNLQGSGDVWAYAPTLEIADESPGAGTEDRIVIGHSRQ
jgi:hypothetical protein